MGLFYATILSRPPKVAFWEMSKVLIVTMTFTFISQIGALSLILSSLSMNNLQGVPILLTSPVLTLTNKLLVQYE